MNKKILKRISAFIIAIAFTVFCCAMPFVMYKASAASVGTLMLATSVLLSLYMIGIHTDSSGVTNFEHVANAIQEQYREDFVYENYQNMVTGEAETRFGQLYNMWQEGVIDISSDAWASFKQWALDTCCGAFESGSSGPLTQLGDGYIFPFVSYSSSSTTSSLSLVDGSVVQSPSSLYGVYFVIYPSVSSPILNSNFIINSNNHIYFVSCGSPSGSQMLLYYRNTTSGAYTGSANLSYTLYNGLAYSEITGFFSRSLVLQNLSIPSTDLTVKEYIDQIVSGSLTPDIGSDFALSLDQNTVYNQVKEIADTEIGSSTTQDLLNRAKYLNDCIGQHTKDGSDLVNLRDATIPYQGDADATADALLTGDYTLPDLQQSLGLETTVQGTIVDTATPSVDIATPTDIAESVPLVVNPSLTVVMPQEYTYPNRYGGDFSFPLANYFPFCMPFDALRILKMVNGSPQAPQISFNASGIFGGYFANYSHGEDGDLVKIRGDTVTLDLSAYDSVAMICRVMLYLLFLVGVCFGIRNWIHGGD